MMNQIHQATVWRTRLDDFLLAGHCLFVLAGIVVGLPLVSFDRIVAVADFLAELGPLPSRRHGDDPQRIARGVLRANRVLRRATCLAQALAVHALLKRRGIPSDLIIGFRPDASGPNGESHAWATCGGAVIIGDSPDLDSFIPILLLDGEKKDHSRWGGIS
ncbi:MAG: lasso peptide biosynthesis B2 protein [Candidatus Hydrogenedens sp.]|nr:lasso peptide biosynthesis B2 protein [Candidatus Hydrogenedens sp.]